MKMVIATMMIALLSGCATAAQKQAAKDSTFPNPFIITDVQPGQYTDYKDYVSKQHFHMKGITPDVLSPYMICIARVFYYIASPSQKFELDSAAKLHGLTANQSDDFRDDFFDDNEPDDNLNDRIRFNCGPEVAAIRPQVRKAYGDKAAESF